jgi:hypothetical protein
MYLYAGIAQLVERCLAKAKVAGSSPVSRSNFIQIVPFQERMLLKFGNNKNP